MAPAPAINLVQEPCRSKRGGVRSPVRVDAAMSTDMRSVPSTAPTLSPIAYRWREADVLRWPYVRPEQHIEGTPAARVAARYGGSGRTAAPFTGWPGPSSLSGLCAVMVGRHFERRRPMRRAAAAADEVPEERSLDIAR